MCMVIYEKENEKKLKDNIVLEQNDKISEQMTIKSELTVADHRDDLNSSSDPTPPFGRLGFPGLYRQSKPLPSLTRVVLVGHFCLGSTAFEKTIIEKKS